MRRKELIVLLGIVALVAFGAMNVHASGFAIVEQGVRGLGTAYAGAAALAEDPSTIFYNPAGLTQLKGQQLEAGLHYIIPRAEFNDKGTTSRIGLSTGTNDGGDGGEPAFVPNFYYSHSLSEDFKVGIGVFAPYGLATKYDPDWVGRYYAIKSELATININPTMAYRINSQWSVGAGISMQYIDATLSSKADLGLGLGPGFSQAFDGFSEISGDDWGYGFNLGFMFEPIHSTRIGVAYRSMISHELEGRAKWEFDPTVAPVAAALNFVDGSNISADVDIPETFSLAVHHAFSDKWAVVADATWTKWSHLDEIRIKYDSGQSDTVLDLQWDDTWRYGAGVIYKPNSKCTGRFGIAFDKTPIPDAAHRTPRIPGEDRFWVAIGGGYKATEKFEFNFGYTHIFVADPKVDTTGTSDAAQKGTLIGEWDASVDIISANVTYAF